jgi:thiol-disulfide isomerase/thioredoxin
LLVKDVVETYQGRARFVSEDYGNSRLAKRYSIKRYPVIFVDEALLARPEDFGGWGKASGKYHPWRGNATTHAKFKKDLQRMIDLSLRGRAPATKKVETESVQEIAALPSLTATDLNGQAVASTQFAGRVTIVEFWATWCGPCRSTLGWLGELQQRYRDKVEVITIAVESEEADVRQQLAALKHPLRAVLGTESLAAAFGGIRSVPTMFVFDRQGKMARIFYGAPEGLHLQAEGLVRTLLQSTASVRPAKAKGSVLK